MGQGIRRMLLVLGSTALLAGCGGSDTTTVIQESAPEEPTQTVTERTTTVTEEAPSKAPGESAAASGSTSPSGEPPDTVGLSLPSAERALKSEGWKPDVSNTDTALGIIVKSNYTVCKQDEPIGNLVPILAQKYGC